MTLYKLKSKIIMRNSLSIIIGLLILVLGIGAFFLNKNQKKVEYFTEDVSKYSFEETIAQLEAMVEDTEGWKILKTYDLQASMSKHGYTVQPVKVYSLCNPDYSSKILFSNQERVVSSMMPCRVSVYVKTDGKTYISRMNSADMAAQMGGLVNEVMTDASEDVEKILSDLIKED